MYAVFIICCGWLLFNGEKGINFIYEIQIQDYTVNSARESLSAYSMISSQSMDLVVKNSPS